MKNYSFYFIKILSVLFLFYGLAIFIGEIYASYTFYKLVDSNNKMEARINSDPALASKISELEERAAASGQPAMSKEERNQAFGKFQQLEGLAAVGAFIGVLFVIGSLATLFSKKWGIYTIIVSVVLTWLHFFMLVNGIRENIILLLVLTAAGAFLLFQKKFISNYQNISV